MRPRRAVVAWIACGATATLASVLLLLGVIGAVVTARQPRNAVGWILCAIP